MANAKELQPQLDTALARITELEASLAGATSPHPPLPPAIDEHEAANVIEAINRVKRDLPGIARVRDPDSDIKYPFRGIEALTAHLQGLTARHGIVIQPVSATELPTSYEYTTSTGTIWHETHVHYRWAVYGPGGIDDVIYGESIGYGRDNSDKGASKSQTQGFKEFLIKLFCIGDKSSDGDTHTTEEQQQGEPAGHTFGAGQAPATPPPTIDWHALGWADAPIPTNASGTAPAKAAREKFEQAMKDVKAAMDAELDEDTIKKLLADRAKSIGPLPLSVAKVRTWEAMVDAAIREANGDDEWTGRVLREAFPGSEEVPTDVTQDPA